MTAREAREAMEKLRQRASTPEAVESMVFWLHATLETVTVVATYLLPLLGVAALLKYLLY